MTTMIDNTIPGPMTLGALMDTLKEFPKDATFPMDDADSYRGDYADLALDGAPTTVNNFLKFLKKNVRDKVLIGYKGGDYTMHENVGVWISPYGETTDYALGDVILDEDKNEVVLVLTNQHRYNWDSNDEQ